jgi:MFS family permease
MRHSPRSHYFAGLSRSTAFLALASFFADISTELLYPVLPVFLTDTLKAGGGVVGLVDGAAQAVQNLVQGFSGWLSDRLQRRKRIALAGYAIAALAKPLIGMSSTWPGVLGARVLDRFGSGARSAPRDALIASSVSEANRGKAFGLEGFGDNLGACVGPLLAVVLLNTLYVQLRVLFYLAAIPGFISVCLIALVKERPTKLAAQSRLDVSIERFPARYWKYLLATALFGIGNSSNAFLILQTRDVGVSLTRTILIYAAFNLVAALTSYPAGFLSDRMGRRNLLAISLGVFALTYLGFAITRHIVVIACCFILYGMYQGVSRSVGKALAADLVPESLRASGLGWYMATTGLFGLLASVVAGQLWDRIGHPAMFLYGAVFAALGVLALLGLVSADAGGHRA